MTAHSRQGGSDGTQADPNGRPRPRVWWPIRGRSLLPPGFGQSAPLDLRIVGRMLLHAALVGVAGGLAGAAFFGSLEYAQRLLLEQLAGYTVLRAHGETFAAPGRPGVFRPWLLWVLPAIGGLACGALTRLAPETRGGGGDAVITAFHQGRGIVRRRVIWVKALASLFTLGTGGAGGREGPTMQIGGALGSYIGRALDVSARERRILLVAGIAAGISAVFRTPLGAALLAVEVLYRDGFESDALIPSVLASVIAYSVVISIFGESTLLAHAPRFPFVPAHLPLYAVLALLIAFLGAAFVALLRRSHELFERLPIPAWTRPAVGGLALGILCTPVIVLVGASVDARGHGLGILGGGYGAIQSAISGAKWLPDGWAGVQMLVFLSVLKLVAASLTIGSGGSAGDFAPSLAIGGLFGGAFGRAAQLLFSDPRIDPGAFALVGMGVFYGGIAHVPLAALVLVCELAGNYDLLVPLMLSQGIAFVAVGKRALYPAQVATQSDSPVHRDSMLMDALRAIRVSDVFKCHESLLSFAPGTPTEEMLRHASEPIDQQVFPVIDNHTMVGLVTSDALHLLATERANLQFALAVDLMQPPVYVHPDDDLRRAAECLIANGLRQVPVLSSSGTVLGLLDEHEIAKIHLSDGRRAEEGPPAPQPPS